MELTTGKKKKKKAANYFFQYNCLILAKLHFQGTILNSMSTLIQRYKIFLFPEHVIA